MNLSRTPFARQRLNGSPSHGVLWAGLLLLAAAIAPAYAAVSTDCSIASNVFIDFDGGFGQTSASCSGSQSIGTSTMSGFATAVADIGILRATASVSASGQNRGTSEAVATWFDTITLSSSAVDAGTSVEVFLGFFVEGFLDASGIAEAAFSLTFGSCSSALCSPSSPLAGASVTATSGDPAVGTIVERSTFVRVGEAQGLSMRLVARANKPEALEEPRNGAATVDFSGTAYWGGILDVRHGGVSIPFELVTGSGLDLRQSFRPAPVPLPAALWVFMGGLAGLLSMTRGSRKAGAHA